MRGVARKEEKQRTSWKLVAQSPNRHKKRVSYLSLIRVLWTFRLKPLQTPPQLSQNLTWTYWCCIFSFTVSLSLDLCFYVVRCFWQRFSCVTTRREKIRQGSSMNRPTLNLKGINPICEHKFLSIRKSFLFFVLWFFALSPRVAFQHCYEIGGNASSNPHF